MSTVLQNVNLYLPEFRKKKHWLDAEKMVLLAGAAVVLLLVTSVYEYYLLYQLRSEVADKELQRQEIATATAALINQYGDQTEDPTLLQAIQALEADLESKQALLQFLEGRELGNAEGFSEHLADLSRYHVQGLSLTEVTLTNGGRSVELGGEVVKAELVPLYIQNLSKGRTFAGKNFEELEIEDAARSIVSETGSVTGEFPVWTFHFQSQAQ